MNSNHSNALFAYLSNKRGKVKGWLAQADAEIYRAILTGQNDKNISGGLAEIGVHHGKSFIALCLAARPGDKAIAVDVFDEQHYNLDKSGRGNRVIFEKNLRYFGIPGDSVIIKQISSLDLRPDEVLDAVGSVRFFSIDGGHWLTIVENDLRIAEGCLSDCGVIALDDFHRPEWPDVSAGYFAWHSARRRPIVPFAIGFNKLFLCMEHHASEYQKMLEEDRFLKYLLVKKSKFQSYEVPVFSQFLIPELNFFRKIQWYLKQCYPSTGYLVNKITEPAKQLRQAVRDQFLLHQ